MRVKGLFAKPRWEHKDAEVRRQAVATGDDPRLAEALPTLAEQDPAPEVRREAVKRLGDLHRLMALAESDPDADVRASARRGYRDLLAGRRASAPPAAERRELVARLDDTELIEHLSCNADDAGVRRAALERVQRTGLLGDRAIQDTDPELRLAALERIEQRSTLERVAQRTRKTDKRVHRRARERLETLAIAAGDPAAIRRRATAVCESLEALVRDTADDRRERLRSLERDWEALGAVEDETLTARYRRARAVVVDALEGRARERAEETTETTATSLAAAQAPTEAAEPTVTDDRGGAATRDAEKTDDDSSTAEGPASAAGEDAAVDDRGPHPKLIELLDRARELQQAEEIPGTRPGTRQIDDLTAYWDKVWGRIGDPAAADRELEQQFRSLVGELRQRLEAHHASRRAQRQELSDSLDRLEEQLDAGDLSAALSAQQAAHSLVEALYGASQRGRKDTLLKRWNQLQGRVRDLRGWQHWANNKVRKRLCEEVEKLPEQGVHPDAIAERIREAKAEWHRLDASERLPDADRDHPISPGLWRRFRAAMGRAYKPAKPYFDKRHELRARKREEIESLCETLEGLHDIDDADMDWKALGGELRRGRQALRRVDELEPKDRGRVAKRLRDAIHPLSRRMDDHHAQIETIKRGLIEEAKALVDEPDLGRAVSGAKAIQRRWKEAGPTRRRTEQALWQELRSHCDAVFARVAEQDKERAAAREDEAARQRELCEELERISELPLAELPEAEADVQRKRRAWRELKHTDNQLAERFKLAFDRFQQRLAERRRQQARERLRRLSAGSALCRRLEDADSSEGLAAEVEREWAALESEDPDAAGVLSERYQRALEPLRDGTSDDRAPASGDDDERRRDNLERLQSLCVHLELLAGLESPPEAQQLRMNLQVSRLSASLKHGEPGDDPRRNFWDLVTDWHAIGPVPADAWPGLSERFERAAETLIQNEIG